MTTNRIASVGTWTKINLTVLTCVKLPKVPLLPTPCSLLPAPCSLLPVPCSLFPVPCSLKVVPHQIENRYSVATPIP
ncbi:MAG: hypothetical protein F6J94_26765 [Moorea sp. SIO1F2]|nr:hypothetical protein [Moorena sp. SIO1F2]